MTKGAHTSQMGNLEQLPHCVGKQMAFPMSAPLYTCICYGDISGWRAMGRINLKAPSPQTSGQTRIPENLRITQWSSLGLKIRK